STRSGRNNCRNQDATIVIFQPEITPLGRIEQLRVSDSQVYIFVVMAVLNVMEKTLHHRRRDHVSDSLSDIAAVSLKCDTDYFSVLHHRATAVTRIDLSADLNGKVLVDGRVGVELEIGSRHNPSGDRHAFAADWESVG